MWSSFGGVAIDFAPQTERLVRTHGVFPPCCFPVVGGWYATAFMGIDVVTSWIRGPEGWRPGSVSNR